MSEPSYDTPETVAEKMKNIPAIIAMWNHYLVAQHDGDYFGCEECNPDA